MMFHLFLLALGFNIGPANAFDSNIFLDRSQVSTLVTKCEQGSGEDCRNASVYFRYGWGMPVNAREAFRLSELGCGFKDGQACAVGVAILINSDKVLDGQRVRTLAHKGCEFGSLTACNNEAYFFANVAPKDEKKAASLWLDARDQAEMECGQGILDGCELLGNYLIKGRGGPQDIDRGTKILRDICTSKFETTDDFMHAIFSCTVLAQYEYSTAHSSPKTKIAEANRLFELCPATGNRGLSACVMLSQWAEKGDGSFNGISASEWRRRACEAGSGFSCSKLGNLATNEIEKTRLFERSCAGLDAGGCVEYISRLESGIGIEADQAKAKELRTFVCSTIGVTCR